MIRQTVEARRQLVEVIEGIPESEFGHRHEDKLSVDEYLLDFYEHDRHHMAQIHTYLASFA
ncbi:hypothetical protein VQ056_30025 [Paenibacillus sp. JTLBN-2024]